jgi:hypothetical protein
MVRVSGVPYEVELLPASILESISEYLAIEREECARIAEIPHMTPANIARCIRARGHDD